MVRICPYTKEACTAKCGKYDRTLEQCAELSLVDILAAFMDDQSDCGSPSSDLIRMKKKMHQAE